MTFEAILYQNQKPAIRMERSTDFFRIIGPAASLGIPITQIEGFRGKKVCSRQENRPVEADNTQLMQFTG